MLRLASAGAMGPEAINAQLADQCNKQQLIQWLSGVMWQATEMVSPINKANDVRLLDLASYVQCGDGHLFRCALGMHC